MITQLTGVIVQRKPPLLVLSVGGVGYEMQMPMTSFSNLPADGEATVLTHMHVREDAHVLFGFTAEEDRDLFRELIKISGIGPRIALAILSSMDSNTFVRYIAERATDRLTSVPGIGKKTAERVLLEMKGRLNDIDFARSDGAGAAAADGASEAISALMTLGYKATDAKRLVEATGMDNDANVEEIVRAALKGGVR